MEASALTHASRRGLLARRSPLLKLQGDEKLVTLVRDGNRGAFDAIVDRYQARLLGFCRQMLGSTEDAEDVLQEVFVNAYRAMLADGREINLRPWLYRIARNRCLNHLRKPAAEAKESMDAVPTVEAETTHERVHNREEFRKLLVDVNRLPETQRSALLLREMDALSYEDIAVAMDTTVPSVKSLLVRARISLAEASQARQLTCGEVRLELAEAAEGLRKASGPVRRHVRDCKECGQFRDQVRSDAKVLAVLSPVGPLLALKAFLGSKLGFGGGASASGAGASAAGAGAGGAGAGTLGAGAGTIGVGAAASGLSAVGSAIGTKAVAGVVTAAMITAGAVGVKQQVSNDRVAPAGPVAPRVVDADSRSAAAAPTVPGSTHGLQPQQQEQAQAQAQQEPPLETAASTTTQSQPPAAAADPLPAAPPALGAIGATADPAPPTVAPVPGAPQSTTGSAGASTVGSTTISTGPAPQPTGPTVATTVSEPSPSPPVPLIENPEPTAESTRTSSSPSSPAPPVGESG